MTTHPLFSRRHYNWLAAWAAAHLTDAQCEALARDLARANDNFNPARFLAACAGPSATTTTI